MDSMSTVLRVKNISKQYKKQQVLSNISFSVEKNEIITILGASGCGKTSLLKIISGLLAAGSGSVALHGQIIDELPPEKRNIGMVFQNYLLFPFMTVYENIAFGLRMRNIAPTEQKERIRLMASILGIEQKLFEYPKALSAGQQQRVALARVFVVRFPLILLDEPFSNLDPHLREDMYDILLSLHHTSSTSIILVTHNANEAMFLSKKIGILHDSQMVQFDTTTKVFHQPVCSEVAQIFGNKNALPVTITEGKKIHYYDAAITASKSNEMWVEKPGSYMLTCHPEFVRVGTSLLGRENVLEGEILSMHQLGGSTHVKIKVREDFVYAILDKKQSIEPGSRVHVQLPQEHVQIMVH